MVITPVLVLRHSIWSRSIAIAKCHLQKPVIKFFASRICKEKKKEKEKKKKKKNEQKKKKVKKKKKSPQNQIVYKIIINKK